MVSYLDESVGRLRTLLEELGHGRDTLVLFTSDNGTTYNGGTDQAFFNSLGGLRGQKGSLWEGGIRVPTIAWWPGTVRAGATTDHVAGCWDILPTLVDLAGGTAPANLDGLSFAPLLSGRDQPAHGHLYFEYPAGGGQQAVIQGSLKGIRPNLKQRGLELELYDLAADPSEQTNLAADRPELVHRMAGILAADRVPSSDFPLPGSDPTR
jgi:arylsulfatase